MLAICRDIQRGWSARLNTIRAKHLGRDIGAGLKNLVGGELRTYTDLMTEARGEAVGRMVDQATSLGANAVLNVRFTTSQVAGSAAELYAYGTAVVVEPNEGASLENTIEPSETFEI
ncbi:MAG: YbjQ family protein [Acidimicrobiales bacterium]|nr:YbjQ family protein [Acidimicrobiales bacterium]